MLIFTVQVKVALQVLQEVYNTDITRPPDIRRQKNGMPPNYVHSLDSTHMMLTSLCCHRYITIFIVCVCVCVCVCVYNHPLPCQNRGRSRIL